MVKLGPGPDSVHILRITTFCVSYVWVIERRRIVQTAVENCKCEDGIVDAKHQRRQEIKTFYNSKACKNNRLQTVTKRRWGGQLHLQMLGTPARQGRNNSVLPIETQQVDGVKHLDVSLFLPRVGKRTLPLIHATGRIARAWSSQSNWKMIEQRVLEQNG